MWGTANTPAGQRTVGAGRIIWGKTAREVLLADGLKPDAILTGTIATDAAVPAASSVAAFDFMHKTLGKTDYYFVSSQNRQAASLTATFRVSGKQPELWDAVTGEIRPATAFRQANGQTTIPLLLNSFGSVFVVFRKPISVN